jgi:nucleoside-diphosphate-sugar epimerase
LKKILVLGSEGQIGKHLCYFLKKKNYKVYEADLVKSSLHDLRKYKNKKIMSLIKKSDFIFFLAFDVGGSRYLKSYQNTYNFLINNLLIMSNTFQILKNKKFIFASSQMSNMNYSSYGVLKKVGEIVCSSLSCISVRFWNVYGVERDLKKSHVITDFILAGSKFKKISMLTNGQEKRDFLHVDDACSGLEVVMKNFEKLKKFKAIDLNYGRYTKIIEVAKIIQKCFKDKNKIVKILRSKKKDLIQFNKKNKSLKNNFFKNHWKPKISLEVGIKNIFNYYIK